MHKPLLIAVCLPYIRSSPWQLCQFSNFRDWKDSCLVCSKLTTGSQSLFCMNYASSHRCWTPCCLSWCPSCCSSNKALGSQVAELEDVWYKEEKEKDQLLYARNGISSCALFNATCVPFGLFMVRILSASPLPTSICWQAFGE